LFIEGILTETSVFKGEKGSICSKEAYAGKLKKHMYLWKGNHVCSKQEHPVHGFTVLNDLRFQSNTSCNFGVPRWR
jgi:hypothetical protein